MPLGRKKQTNGTAETPTEAVALDYLRQRDENIMRNDEVFQSLGLTTLADQLKGKSARNKDDVPEKSGSLYNVEDDEGSNQHDEDEVSMASKLSAGGSKASKRVVAPQEFTRVTRQRTAANQSLAVVVPDALASTNATRSQNEDHINSDDEGAIFASAQQVQRGNYRGKELDALNRGLGAPIKIDIAEGSRRPQAPIQAAKLASKAGVTLRDHTPIFPHWKEYKKIHNKYIVKDYIGKIAGSFDIDTKNKAVQAACIDMLKGGQRQMRHRLKKKYFDGVPANLVRTTYSAHISSCNTEICTQQQLQHKKLLWKKLRLHQCKKVSSRCLLLKLFPRYCLGQAHFSKMWGCQPPSQVVEVQLAHRCGSYRLNLRLRSKSLCNLSKNLQNLSKRWLAKHVKLMV